MSALADRILAAVVYQPLDDDVLAERLGVSQRQSVNQAARRLVAQGRLRRYTGADGKIVNALPDTPLAEATEPTVSVSSEGRITEDEVKTAVRDHLVAEGFEVTVAWGRTRGIDLDARQDDGRRFVIEAKGEAPPGAQQVNYFLGAIGELVQRMSDPAAVYALALPDHRQYRGLVERLPTHAVERLGLTVFWVGRTAEGLVVSVGSHSESR